MGMKAAIISLILASGFVCISGGFGISSFIPSTFLGLRRGNTPDYSSQVPEDPSTVSRDFEIEATPEDCFRVAVGFEDHHPKFAKSLRSVRVLKRTREGLGKVVEFKALMLTYTLEYTLEYEFNYPRGLKWNAVSGFKAMVGSYVFTKIGPTRTHVKYHLRVDPGFHLPNWLKKAVASMIVQASIKEFKTYIESPAMQSDLNARAARRRSPFRVFAHHGAWAAVRNQDDGSARKDKKTEL
mmetsp:Transcript_72135/g.150699  ORF Transcript_72135/g.150699 Transcript_72135/m.150699 type:complete len:240 (-) Transcript_72135:238-957(-)